MSKQRIGITADICLAAIFLLGAPLVIAGGNGCRPVENPNPDDLSYLSALFGGEAAERLTTGTEDRCHPEYGDPGYTGQGATLDEYESVNESYYYTVDRLGQRTTLADWRALHGFDDEHGNQNPDVVNADYINAYDLGLGRKMSCLKTSNLGLNALPCVVENFLVGDDPDNPTDPVLFASVAMERVRATNSARQYTAFFAFDAQGNRINSVDLDGKGEKRIPEVCWSCHDGAIGNGHNGDGSPGSQGGQYLAFDTELYTRFPGALPIAQQELAFKQLNAIIYEVAERANGDGDAHRNIKNLIELWYGGDPEYSDPGSINFDNVRPITAGHDERAVFYAKYCRTCHVAQTGPYGEDHPTDPPPQFNCTICHTAAGDAALNVMRVMCPDSLGSPPAIQMPNALVTHRRASEDNLNIDGTVRLDGSPVLSSACTAAVSAPDPANDLIADATPATPGAVEGSLVSAKQDGASSVGVPGKPDIWFTLEAPSSGTYSFDTCGTHDRDGIDTGMDTVLSIHSFADGTELVANDDWPSGSVPDACTATDSASPRDSAAALELAPAERVRIRVSVYNNTAGPGDFVLNVKVPGCRKGDILEDRVIDRPITIAACNKMQLGPNLRIEAPGSVTVNAKQVAFVPGLSFALGAGMRKAERPLRLLTDNDVNMSHGFWNNGSGSRMFLYTNGSWEHFSGSDLDQMLTRGEWSLTENTVTFTGTVISGGSTPGEPVSCEGAVQDPGGAATEMLMNCTVEHVDTDTYSDGFFHEP